MNVPAVRAALVARLGTIDDNLTVYETVPANAIQLPCVLTYPPDTIDFMHLHGTARVTVPILALVGPQDPTAQTILEGLMSWNRGHRLSICDALYADRRLGGLVSNLRMLDMTSGAYSVGTGPDDNGIGAEFRVEILA